jgi:hypothetical protein
MGFVVEDKHGGTPYRGAQELIALPGVEYVRIAAEDVFDGIRRREQDERAVACDPNCEWRAKAAAATFKERQWPKRVIEKLPDGRGFRTGR